MTASRTRANWILALLVLLNILNIVDRNLISSFGPQITQDLNLSDTQFGLLTGIIFGFFYTIAGIFVGRLADIVNRPRLIAVGLMVWSALTIVSGAAKNFVQIGLARLLVGVGEACLSPAAISMLADIFPSAKRGLAVSVYYLGVPLGAGASFVAAGLLGPLIGWRNCFYLLGVLGLILVPILFFVRDPERGQFDHDPKTTSEAALSFGNLTASLREVWQLAKQSPAIAWTMLGGVCMHLSVGSAQFAIIWLVRERGFDAAHINSIYGLLFIVFGTLAALVSGAMSDWYLKRFRGGRTRFLAILLLLVTPLIIVYRLAEPGSTIFYIGMSTGFVAFMSMFGPTVSTIQDLTPAHLRGVTMAIFILGMNLIGVAAGALMTGVLSDAFSALGVQEPLTWSLVSIDILSVFTITSFLLASIYWARQFPSPEPQK